MQNCTIEKKEMEKEKNNIKKQTSNKRIKENDNK